MSDFESVLLVVGLFAPYIILFTIAGIVSHKDLEEKRKRYGIEKHRVR